MRNCITYIEKNILVKGERGAIMSKTRAKISLRGALREIRTVNILMLFIAGIINSFGVTMFLFPVKLYDSGISGLSMLLDQLTPDYLTLSLFLIIINVPIFVFGLKRQGVTFTIYSIFAVAVYSLASFMIMDVLPVDVSFISPLAGSQFRAGFCLYILLLHTMLGREPWILSRRGLIGQNVQ